MEELSTAIAGQEELVTSLFRHPEIVAEFGETSPDMNNRDDRLRVWGIMYRVYQRESPDFGGLNSLLRLMQQYLRVYTRHTSYNLRDFGVSYLTVEFPRDLVGRAVRDCGVYALTLAYEVYLTARRASPRLQLSFQLFAMPEHVALVIFDHQRSTFYVANNDRIQGPYTVDAENLQGSILRRVARAYGGITGRHLLAPFVRVEIGSTSLGPQAFRSRAWQRYRIATQWSLRPENWEQLEPGERLEAVEATYQLYYQGAQRYNNDAEELHRRLDRLSDGISRGKINLDRDALNPLMLIGEQLRDFFIGFGTHASLMVTSPDVREVIRGATGYLFTTGREGQSHPLTRLGMALIYYQDQGATLSDSQAAMLLWLRSVPDFDDDLNQYNPRILGPNF